jgi:hypothetical protein
LYSVRVFSTSCDSAWITSSLFYLQSEKQGSAGRVRTKAVLCEAVRCRDTTARSFVAKVRWEVFAHFHAFTIKRRSCMRDRLSGLPRWILSEQSPRCQRKWLACSWLCFVSLGEFGLPALCSCLLPRALVWSLPRSTALSSRFAQNLMMLLCFVELIAKFHQFLGHTKNMQFLHCRAEMITVYCSSNMKLCEQTQSFLC